MTLAQALERLERDRERHVLGPPASAAELDELERELGYELPADYRTLLQRFGGGLLYNDHELAGGQRVLMHDIELVPDLKSFGSALAGKGSATLVPFHRSRGVGHGFDPATGAVRELDGGRAFPDLASFLEAVVLPRPEP